MLLQRIPAGRLIASGFAAMSALSCVRAVAGGREVLLVCAFLAGAALSLFMVSFPPVIAGMAREDKRSWAYGVFFASGIAIGIVGGVLGGRLAGWIGGGVYTPNQSALLTGSGLMAAAALPMWGLGVARPVRERVQALPRSSHVWRFAGAIALWNLATGAFNPFFNTYFARQAGASVSQIGSVFSISQFAQAAAMLASAAVLRRTGLVRGIALMQTATALALMALGAASRLPEAAVLYVVYMTFQWMSEPGMYAVLMAPLRPHEMSSAAGLNSAVTLAGQLTAASAGGYVIVASGYPALLGSAGVVGAAAGMLFWILLRPAANSRN
jgi:predicted MFS family arabinose efflux permease